MQLHKQILGKNHHGILLKTSETSRSVLLKPLGFCQESTSSPVFLVVLQTSSANVEIHRYMKEVVVDHLVDNSLASISRTKPHSIRCFFYLQSQ